MRISGNWNDFVAYPYKLVTAASVTPISLTEVKTFLKLDVSDTSEDTLITMFIEAATDYAEKYTRRDFINKTYITYRDQFEDIIEIRRSKLQSVSFVKYYNTSNVLTTLSASIYALTDEVDYSSVFLAYNQEWPTVLTYGQLQPIQIQFVAGYGALATAVPSLLRIALLQHVVNMYENRGDCTSDSGCDCAGTLPSQSKSIYNTYKIKDIIGRGSRDPNSNSIWRI